MTATLSPDPLRGRIWRDDQDTVRVTGERTRASGTANADVDSLPVWRRRHSFLDGVFRVGILRDGVLALIAGDERVFIAGRISVANLGASGLGVPDALDRVVLDQLAGLPGLAKQLCEGLTGLIPGFVVPELGPLRHLGAFGLIEPVLKDVTAVVVRILDESEVSLPRQLCPPLRLPAVLQLQEAADDLLLASLLH